MGPVVFAAWLRDAILDLIDQVLDKRLKGMGYKQGTVTAVVGSRVKVRFPEEETASDALYDVNPLYTPLVNDVVYMVPSGSTWVVAFKLP